MSIPQGFRVRSEVVVNFSSTSHRSTITLDMQAEPNFRDVGEVLTFVAFTLRQIVNVDVKGTGSAIAATLMDLHNPESFTAFLDSRGSVPTATETLERRFIGSLHADEVRYSFRFHPKGFGFMSRKAVEYAPASVLELLAFLAQRRREDEQYLGALRASAGQCAELVGMTRHGQANLSVMTQHQFPLPITLQACGLA